MSFRNRMLLSFLFLFAASMGSVTYFLHYSAIETEKKDAIEQLTRNTGRVLDDLDTFIHNRLAEMATMATARVWTDDSPLKYVNLRLDLYRDFFHIYDRIYVIAENGTIYADTESWKIGRRDEHQFWQEAVKGKQGYDPMLLEDNHAPAVYFYNGLHSFGNKRVLVSRVPFSSLNLLIRGFERYQKTGEHQLRIELINEKGDLLFSNVNQEALGGKTGNVAEFTALLDRMTAQGNTSNVSVNETHILITARNKSTGNKKTVPWVMRIEMPKALLFKDIYVRSKNLIIISISLTSISMLLIWFIASGLSRPVQEIVRHAEMIGKGDFSKIAGLPRRSDEFGILVESLQVMAASLKEAIDSLRLSEERWKFALEGAGEGVWDWDIPAHHVYVSPRWKALLGYEDEEGENMYGKWEALIHPDDYEKAVSSLRQHLDGDVPFFLSEHRLRCKDGTYKWMLARGLVIHRTDDGKPLRVIGVHADISQRKMAEQLLRSSQEKFKLLADFTADWEYWVDENKQVVYTSPSSERLCGYTPTEFHDDPSLLSRIVHPLDQQQFDEHMEQFHNHGKLSQEATFRIITKNGDVVWIGHMCYPVVDKDGVFRGRRVSNRDITRQKLMEESLRESKEKLSELNLTLEALVRAEVEKNREKDRIMMMQGRLAVMGEMLGNIAHQWRQPLNNLGLILQIIREEFKQKELTENQMDRHVRDAMEHIRHMSKTIDDFRNFFKKDKSIETFSINKVVRKALLLIDASFRENGITVELDESEDVTVRGYPGEYSQVLMNVLSNARDVLLERKVKEPCIRIQVFQVKTAAVVTIADNAGGIPEEILDRIFDPYFTTKEQGKGTGIGLYMAKTIIEKNMQGSLTARNIPGGAEFRIEV